MAHRLAIFALLLSLAVSGCGGDRSNALSTAHAVGLPQLRTELQALAASLAGQKSAIPPSAWPKSVQRFKPVAVQLHLSGVLIVLGQSGRVQQSLLVVSDPKDDPGDGGSGVSYERLGDGLYWCVEQIRMPAHPPAGM
jgi:hypothetical protein